MSRAKSRPFPAAQRLQKVLAAAGFGSRRRCEELIASGQVKINGSVVKEMGVRVDPGKDRITCGGRPVRAVRTVVLALNKPRSVLTTVRDDRGRRTVMDLLPKMPERVYPVGRLDWDSQGLLLMTNDGELTNLLTHPRYGVPRSYHVVVKGELTSSILERMQRGVWLSEGKTGPVRVKIRRRDRQGAVLEVTLHEGMNREVRRIFARFGLKVKRLKRVRVGPIGLDRLPTGGHRFLTPREIGALRTGAKRGKR